MNLDQFIQKYNGKKVDFDGNFGAQCVDLYRFYLKDLGIAQTPPVMGAYQLFETWPYEKFKNTPLGIPQKGDIMIWGQSYGKYGHVGIVVDANLMKFQAFEQNDPTNAPCQIKTYNYKGVIGWLRLPARDDITSIKTQNKGGELRIVIGAGNPETWNALCKKYNLDPKIINETI